MLAARPVHSVLDPSDGTHRGFKQLNPHFAIRDAGDDEHRLPTSSTCVNLLKVREIDFGAPVSHFLNVSWR